MQIYKLQIVTYIYFYSNVTLLNIYIRERRADAEALRRLPPERRRERRAAAEALRRLPPE
jgi:hypothetical protein